MLEGQPFEPAGRLAQFMRIIGALDRESLAAVIERGIDRLDTLDGDADDEDSELGAVMMFDDGRDPNFYGWRDDVTAAGIEEDDDPAGGEITDEPHDAEEDFGVEDKGEGGSWPEDIAPSLVYAYPDDEHENDAPHIIAEFRDRIRRKRCHLVSYGPRHSGWGRYVLDGSTPPCPIGIGA